MNGKFYKNFVNPYSNADRGTRTLTRLPPADFESAASAIPPHPRVSYYLNSIYNGNCFVNM